MDQLDRIEQKLDTILELLNHKKSKTKRAPKRFANIREWAEFYHDKAVKKWESKGAVVSFTVDDILEKAQESEIVMSNWNDYFAGDNSKKPTMHASKGYGKQHIEFALASDFSKRFAK